jgi:acetate kinase
MSEAVSIEGGAAGPGQPAMNGWILVLNCGSSSIKFALFDASGSTIPRAPPWSGQVAGIKGPAPTFSDSTTASSAVVLDTAQPYQAALGLILARVQVRRGERPLAAVAHRVVHGGAKYAEPVQIDAAVLADLNACVPLAPLHQPFALEAIEAMLMSHPELPQVACFDTAFHHTVPQVEQMLPLSYEAWERGLRRYGFHGLSCEFMSIALAERHADVARKRTIAAHLGNGASLCAMQGLRSVATTMGFSALDGLMMGTRCGSLDPGAVLHLMEEDGLTPTEVSRLLYSESGLLGISGISADPRELLQHEPLDERVRAALALYVRRIVRETGALVAVLGGLDLLVFTAGIGEHNAVIRERVCRDLAFLGLVLDDAANQAGAPTISTAASRVRVAVEPTNEEWVAARHAVALLGAGALRH